MTLIAVVDEMRRLGKDPGDAVWDEGSKIDFINRAIKLLCQLKPNIHTSFELVTCVNGPTQNVPPGMRFIRVVALPTGEAITPVDEVELNGYLPQWRGLLPGTPEHYIFDPARPRTFDLYPPVEAGQKVVILVESFPPDVMPEQDFPLDAIYFEPLCLVATALMLYENDADLPLAASHLDRASQLLGLKVEVERAVSTE